MDEFIEKFIEKSYFKITPLDMDKPISKKDWEAKFSHFIFPFPLLRDFLKTYSDEEIFDFFKNNFDLLGSSKKISFFQSLCLINNPYFFNSSIFNEIKEKKENLKNSKEYLEYLNEFTIFNLIKSDKEFSKKINSIFKGLLETNFKKYIFNSIIEFDENDEFCPFFPVVLFCLENEVKKDNFKNFYGFNTVIHVNQLIENLMDIEFEKIKDLKISETQKINYVLFRQAYLFSKLSNIFTSDFFSDYTKINRFESLNENFKEKTVKKNKNKLDYFNPPEKEYSFYSDSLEKYNFFKSGYLSIDSSFFIVMIEKIMNDFPEEKDKVLKFIEGKFLSVLNNRAFEDEDSKVFQKEAIVMSSILKKHKKKSIYNFLVDFTYSDNKEKWLQKNPKKSTEIFHYFFKSFFSSKETIENFSSGKTNNCIEYNYYYYSYKDDVNQKLPFFHENYISKFENFYNYSKLVPDFFKDFKSYLISCFFNEFQEVSININSNRMYSYNNDNRRFIFWLDLFKEQGDKDILLEVYNLFETFFSDKYCQSNSCNNFDLYKFFFYSKPLIITDDYSDEKIKNEYEKMKLELIAFKSNNQEIKPSKSLRF